MRHIRPIHRPRLIGLSGLGWLAKVFAQLQDVIAAFFTQFGNVGFTHRFATLGKAGVEQRRDHAAAGMAARRGQQAQNFHFHPTGFAVLARRLVALRRGFGLSTGERVAFEVGFSPQHVRTKTQNNRQKREVNQPFRVNTHIFPCCCGGVSSTGGLAD
jgi:hypothetical protein